MAPVKKQKKNSENTNTRLKLVMRSGKVALGAKAPKEMVTPSQAKALKKEGYKLIVGPTVTWQRTSPQFPNKGGHYLEADGTKYTGTDGTAMSWDCSDIVSPLDLFVNKNFAAHTDDPACQNPAINQVDGTYMKLTPFPRNLAARGHFPGCFFNVFDGHDPSELNTTAGDISKLVVKDGLNNTKRATIDFKEKIGRASCRERV